MKSLNNYITEQQNPLCKIDDSMQSLILKLLLQFTSGKVDIPEKDDNNIVKAAKKLAFDLA